MRNHSQVEIFPKLQLGTDEFTQSTYQAIDTGASLVGMLQVWIDGGGAFVTVTIQESIINEEDEYSDSTQNSTITVSPDSTSLTKILLPRRFIRLKMQTTAVANVRARLTILDSHNGSMAQNNSACVNYADSKHRQSYLKLK